MFVCHRKPGSCGSTLARPGVKSRAAQLKSPGCALSLRLFLREREKSNNKKQVLGGREGEVRSGAFLCALAVFWCAGPRDPYMVTAEGECEAEGSALLSLSQTSTASREARIQAGGLLGAQAEHGLRRSRAGPAWRIPGPENLFNV